MKRDIHFLEYIYCHLLIVFLIGRVGFMWNNRCVEALSFVDAAGVCWRGLVGHDLMVCAVLLVVPWVVTLILSLAAAHPGGEGTSSVASAGSSLLMGRRGRLALLLAPYYVVMGLAVAAIITGDAVMYEFWQFKLGTVVLSYAASPEGATNSVSLGFILLRAGLFLLLALWIIIPCILLTPRRFPQGQMARLWLRNISIIFAFLCISAFCFMREGDVYTTGQHSTQLADHAAVNPVFAFAKSVRFTEKYASRYDLLSESDRDDLFRNLYPAPADDIQDTLLTTQRPDVLVVFIESFGSRFVAELGGLPGVAPAWSRLIPQGIFWDNYYSNSFRTDRGTVSTFCGWPSYTDIGIMRHAEMHASLPSLARSLAAEGYETSFLYGGAMTNMGKRKFLQNIGFEHLYDEAALKALADESLQGGDGGAAARDVASAGAEKEGSWGIPDSVALLKTRDFIAKWEGGNHFFVAQTLSSHEPWDVPYQRLEDRILNAFAYTDYSIGCLIDSLRLLPQWDNLLVLLLPDHGYLYRQSYRDPGFFRAPMLWTGGAIRQPRRMSMLMNQSDIAATLLAQMGIPHDDYRWSRNVLSKSYVYPFAYCNWPAGLLYVDGSGTSIYDLDGDAMLLDTPASDGIRTMRAKAILQTSYDQLEELRP